MRHVSGCEREAKGFAGKFPYYERTQPQVLRASSGYWAVLVAFLRLAVPAEYDAQLNLETEGVETPLAFVNLLLNRTWTQRRGLQHDLKTLLLNQDGDDCLATVDGRLAMRTLVLKFSSVEEQEEFGVNLVQFKDSESLRNWRESVFQISSSESEGEEPVSTQRVPPAKIITRSIAKGRAQPKSAVKSQSKRAKATATRK